MSLLLLFSSGSTTTQDVWELLHSWYDDHSSIHLVGGFHSDQAPSGTTLPCAVQLCVSEVYDHSIGLHECSDIVVQISIFHTDRDLLETAKLAWIASLRDFFTSLRAASLTGDVGGDNWELSVGRRRLDPDFGPNGERVWIQDLEYVCQLSEDL